MIWVKKFYKIKYTQKKLYAVEDLMAWSMGCG
jgi:hypothetical protein